MIYPLLLKIVRSSFFKFTVLPLLTLLVGAASLMYMFPMQQISGSSMTPTLNSGDKITVQRWLNTPKRHDIFVIDQNQVKHDGVSSIPGSYLKRLIGMPGDVITLLVRDGEVLSINGYQTSFTRNDTLRNLRMESKHPLSIGGVFTSHGYDFSVKDNHYRIYATPESAFKDTGNNLTFLKTIYNFPWLKKQLTSPNQKTLTFTVPKDNYFSLSDNRVVGVDSRHFGFVPKSSLLYKYQP